MLISKKVCNFFKNILIKVILSQFNFLTLHRKNSILFIN